jgi:adenine-specific DNA-methyltransferase
MPPRNSSNQSKKVEALKHEDAKRKNIPTAEYQSVMAEAEKSPIQVAYERRNRDLDPQLVWRGKDEQDWSDLVVSAPPLYIQEKVHPKVLIDDLLRQTATHQAKTTDNQLDLFADFNGLPKDAVGTAFYQHDAHWTNRMILGDSLQVMASLAEREGLRGKVQCIYFDPPYGIKFNSNFQWSTTSRDVKDGKVDHITREPEQVKAFRDTWRDGIHSYLTYLRDRLTVARDLLTESGSIFVQIGDENVHRVRTVMDEVFGEDNCISQISFAKTSGYSTNFLTGICDYILWFGKSRESIKFRQPYGEKQRGEAGASKYNRIRLTDGTVRQLTEEELKDSDSVPNGAKFWVDDNFTSQGNPLFPFSHNGKTFEGTYKTTLQGMSRLAKADRVYVAKGSHRFIRFIEDFPATLKNSAWMDIGGVQSRTDPKVYVVQTATEAVKRCLLMTTDPGDLVLDPTCGSGTTATVAEQWGRRWITIDTSRVALALARARIMGARYPFYLLADSKAGQQKEAELRDGQWSAASGLSGHHSPATEHQPPTHNNIRLGFVYERVPHITLKSIANNAEIDVIWDQWQTRLEPLRENLNAALKQTWQEWEIPREADAPDFQKWPDATKQIHADWWQARIARQKEIDASIVAKAEFEYLYDKPYQDKKTVRVAGPFTVESLSPYRVLAVNNDDDLIDPSKTPDLATETDFASVILENLKTSGVQQAHKEDKINFTTVTGWAGRFICAEGLFEVASDQWPVTSGSPGNTTTPPSHQSPTTNHQPPTTTKRAGIFIGPEFGTVSRPDLVAATREAGDAGFDVLIACAFSFDAHSADFTKLGSIPVLKARMNADLHMANDLKNTGKGNLFVIFGEPDISVVSGRWLVASDGRMVVNYDIVAELSGLGSLAEINRLGGEDLSSLKRLSNRGEIRVNESIASGGSVSPSQHRGGSSPERDRGISAISERGQRVSGGSRNVADSGASSGVYATGSPHSPHARSGHHWTDAQRTQAIAALQTLRPQDLPLTLTTNHQTQVTIHGVDVFRPQSGEVESSGADGIACWFIDTDYNEESFFVRHAYFLGANDPYKALKTTLKAEIDAEAWATLNSDTSRPFAKPQSGRIAVKVINHLGDEVMKVFSIN